MVRYLVVTADDFGYCSERNRGIVAGYLAGGITRTSLLVTAAAAQQAAHLAALHRIPLGLHFNVTEGFPVADKTQVHSLLTETGVFKGKNGFRDAVSNGHVNLDEVKLELEAQLALFMDLTGHPPLFVDGHNHTHVLHGVSSVFAAVLSNAGIRSSRIPHEVALQSAATWVLPPARMAFYKDVVTEATAAATVFDEHGIRFSDGFVGMATMGADMTVQRLESLIHETYQKLALNGTALIEPRVQDSVKDKKCVQDAAEDKNKRVHGASEDKDKRVQGAAEDKKLRVQGATEDVNCDRLMEGVKPRSDQPPCDDPHPHCPPVQNTDSEMDTRVGDAETRGHGMDNNRWVETETQRVTCETEGDMRGRWDSASRHVTASPCDKDKIGEQQGTPHDNNKSRESNSAALVVELMVHPGYPCIDPRGGCGVGPDDFARSAERSQELSILCSSAWRTVCERGELQLCAQLPTRQGG